MPTPLSIDRQSFLGYLRRSGLVSDAALTQVSERMPDTDRGRVVARALVDLGVLTRFQAERLLAGRTAGFTLGQYRILDQIGRGGMGRIFKAQHAALGRVVAIKILASSLVKTPEAQDLFAREVMAVGQLNHPNIVAALDAHESNGRCYLVLEFVDGPNLDQLVKQQGPLPVGLACDYIAQAANGLQAAHAAGIVHRDIKPSNLLVHRPGPRNDAPGLVKVSDFGLARLREPGSGRPAGTILVKENTVMGTPDYLSPEQGRNLHKVDSRTDLYSLGCTFFYLLTGRPPFANGTSLEKIIAHGVEPPPRLSAVRPGVPQEVEMIVQRLLAKHPDDRFQTAAELTDALHPWAVSGPIPWAPPPSSPVRETGSTPSPAEEECDPSDDLAALSAGVPKEALLAPLAECVQAVRSEEKRRRRVKRALLAAAVLAGNALLWWAIVRWI
jgi:serine/threonine-protein kinase